MDILWRPILHWQKILQMKLDKKLNRLFAQLKVGDSSQSTIALMAFATNEVKRLKEEKKKKEIKK